MLIPKDQNDLLLNRLYDKYIIAAFINGVVKVLRPASNPKYVAFYTYGGSSNANFADKHPAGAIKAVQDSGYKVRTFKNLEELNNFAGTGKKPANKINVENHTEAYLARLAKKYFIGYKTGGGTVAQLQFRRGVWGFAYVLKDGSEDTSFPSQLVFAADSAGKSMQQAAHGKPRTLYRFTTNKAFNDFFFEGEKESEEVEPCPTRFKVKPGLLTDVDTAEIEKRVQASLFQPSHLADAMTALYHVSPNEIQFTNILRGRDAKCIFFDDIDKDQPKEEDAMNLNKVEFKEVLNGQDLDAYTDTDILSMIQRCEDNIGSLSNIKTPSKRIDEMKAEQEATIKKLVELLDSRAATTSETK